MCFRIFVHCSNGLICSQVAGAVNDPGVPDETGTVLVSIWHALD